MSRIFLNSEWFVSTKTVPDSNWILPQDANGKSSNALSKKSSGIFSIDKVSASSQRDFPEYFFQKEIWHNAFRVNFWCLRFPENLVFFHMLFKESTSFVLGIKIYCIIIFYDEFNSI